MSRRLALAGAIAALAIVLVSGKATASAVFAGINMSASPASSPTVNVHWGVTDVGWYYTPTASYSLDGIYSLFEAVGTTSVPQTITAQLRSERPGTGGSVLREATFTAVPTSGGYLGVTFVPITLTAGTAYFIDFVNVANVGIDVGSWEGASPSQASPSGGATTNLGAWYTDAAATTTNFATAASAYSYDSTGTVKVSGAEPILFFTGTAIPEPVALAALLPAMALLHRRR